MAKAIAEVMGLKATVVNAPFDSIIPGIAAGKYDLGMSSFTDTMDREKTVDFVTYATAGTSFYVNAERWPNIGSLADLCGHTVAAETGTTQVDDSKAQSQKCTAAGKPAVTVQALPDQNAVNLALSSGRAEVAMADTAGRRLRGEAVGRQVQDLRQLLRQRALRDRDVQGQRPVSSRCLRRSSP